MPMSCFLQFQPRLFQGSVICLIQSISHLLKSMVQTAFMQGYRHVVRLSRSDGRPYVLHVLTKFWITCSVPSCASALVYVCMRRIMHNDCGRMPRPTCTCLESLLDDITSVHFNSQPRHLHHTASSAPLQVPPTPRDPPAGALCRRDASRIRAALVLTRQLGQASPPPHGPSTHT